MYRIGLLGSDNSHADIFARLLNNTPNSPYDACITMICGDDPQRTQAVAQGGSIPTIVQKPSDMLGQVDAVMAIHRHGGLHLPAVLPFLEAHIPVWVDKPFTLTTADACTLVDTAARHNTLLAGGSTCKYTHDIQTLRRIVQTPGQIGTLQAATMSFSVQLDNPYGGFPFYGAHLAEMALAVFGYHPLQVYATRNENTVTALLQYTSYTVTLQFITGLQAYTTTLIGEKGVTTRDIDITDSYQDGFDVFYQALQAGKSDLRPEQIIQPVALLEAIEHSLSSGHAIFLAP